AKFGEAGEGEEGCVAPVDFFLSVGFKTVRPHPRYPRLRLELHRPVVEVRRRVRPGEAPRLDEPGHTAPPGPPSHRHTHRPELIRTFRAGGSFSCPQGGQARRAAMAMRSWRTSM